MKIIINNLILYISVFLGLFSIYKSQTQNYQSLKVLSNVNKHNNC